MKTRIFFWVLLGWVSVAGADETRYKDLVRDDYYDHIYHNTAVSVQNTSVRNVKASYKIVISKTITQPNPSKNIFVKYAQPTVQEIDKPIWTITSDQFPMTEDDCIRAEIDTCRKDDAYYCYDVCLANLPPEILAFDEKTNKLYFMVGAHDIGTGGGSSFVLAADINKKEIKLLSKAWYGEKGSLSPSGRYLVLYNFYAITVLNTQTNIKFKTNKYDNVYQATGKQLYHSLKFQHWLNDTQFSYIDVARIRNFNNKFDPHPFVNAKEIVYDILAKKVLHEKTLTADEVKAAGIKPSL